MGKANHNRIMGLLMSALMLGACSGSHEIGVAESDIPMVAEVASPSAKTLEASHLDHIDNTKWRFNAETNVYWQDGLAYAANPTDPALGTLGIYMPGGYVTATKNPDGETYTVQLNPDGQVGAFTTTSAPWVMPIDTPGYAAMAAPQGYVDAATAITRQGMVYLAAGARGREAGAPAGVTDMKAAIRYVRANADTLAGDVAKIYVYGMSGGGAQAAVLGASGGSPLYDPYLKEIGAVEGVSDAIAGVMAWSPITSFDFANAAYEWQLGVARTGLSEDQQMLSDGLAQAYAAHLNSLELKDPAGTVLTLHAPDGGHQAGTYYEFMKSEIENSLNTFLGNTTFPYTVPERPELGAPGAGPPDAGLPGAGPGGGVGPGAPDTPNGSVDPNRSDHSSASNPSNGLEGANGSAGRSGTGDSSQAEDPRGSDNAKGASERPNRGVGDLPPVGTAPRSGANGGAPSARLPKALPPGGLNLGGKTFASAEEYVAALNAQGEWVTYDATSKEATISSVADFVQRLKPPTKAVGAFDALDATQAENILFGVGNGKGAHFDATMAALLDGTSYAEAFNTDLKAVDHQGNEVGTRVDMVNPMYFLNKAYNGFESAKVAPKWRIRSGMFQGDTALTTETNLALALQQYKDITEVDFATVWGEGHTMAEVSGEPIPNFLKWVITQESGQ